MKHVFIIGLVLCYVKFNKCFPHDSSVISKYAKVAVWSQNKTDGPTGRNIKSGSLWNHRLDTDHPTQKNKNPSVVYQYPVYQRPDPKVEKKIEHVPGIGDVIVAQAQDRFEARPHFAYNNNISPTYLPPSPPKPSDSPAPAYLPPSATSGAGPPAPSGNSYSSPYSSYNPPDFKPDDDSSNDYPPNGHKYGDSAPPMDDSKDSKKSKVPDSYVSLGPPVAPHGDDDHDQPGHGDDNDNDPDHPGHGDDDDQPDDFEPYHYHHDMHEETPPEDPMAMYKHHEGPPQHAPKSVDDVYYPPDFPQDQIPGHGGGQEEHGEDMMKDDMMKDDMMPPESMMPPDDMMDDEKSTHGDEDDHMQAPPPPHDYEPEHGHAAFPKYLYDQHHYDHHVYEEIPHTMAPVKEDKRVSSTHYSYYYLGRKLWYIPLYFSIYFIFYVTVLIVKSIARHKVKLKYKWYEHDHHGKEARSLNLDDVKEERVTEVYRNVSAGLTQATAKYSSVIAMK